MDFSSITYEETPLRRRRRTFILKKAFEIMSDKGIADTALIDIIDAVGMTPRNIYYYYANKDALTCDLHRAVMNMLIRMEFISVPTEGTAHERLHRVLKQFYDYLMKNPQIIRFISEFDCAYINTQHYIDVPTIHKSVQHRIRQLIESQVPLNGDGTITLHGRSPELVWMTMFHSMNSLIQRYVRHSLQDQVSGYVTREHVYLQLELLMAAIKA